MGGTNLNMMENFIVRFKIPKSFEIESHDQDSKLSLQVLKSKVIDAFLDLEITVDDFSRYFGEIDNQGEHENTDMEFGGSTFIDIVIDFQKFVKPEEYLNEKDNIIKAALSVLNADSCAITGLWNESGAEYIIFEK